MSNKSTTFRHYDINISNLINLINELNQKAINDDVLIVGNINFFTKSALVTLCAYLESYLKNVAFEIIQFYNSKLTSLEIPHNLVKWGMPRKDIKSDLPVISDFDYGNIRIDIPINKIEISGNIAKTDTLFKHLGIDLNHFRTTIPDFNSHRATTAQMVDKRNQIIHHDDSASELTFLNVREYAKSVRAYIAILEDIIATKISWV